MSEPMSDERLAEIEMPPTFESEMKELQAALSDALQPLVKTMRRTVEAMVRAAAAVDKKDEATDGE